MKILTFSNPYVIDEYADKIPHRVRQYFKEATLCYNGHIPNAVTIMCKKLLLEICEMKEPGTQTITAWIQELDIDVEIKNRLIKIPDLDDLLITMLPLSKEYAHTCLEAAASIIEKRYL